VRHCQAQRTTVSEFNEAIDRWAHSAINDKIRCEIDVDADEVPGEHYEVLRLVIVELVMNAAKYTFRERNDLLLKESHYEMDLA
jgi:signal transduction histidine kinase